MNKPKLDEFDIQAEREGLAISKAYKPKTADFSTRLRKTYTVDGFRFNTGQRRRMINRNH